METTGLYGIDRNGPEWLGMIIVLSGVWKSDHEMQKDFSKQRNIPPKGWMFRLAGDNPYNPV